MIKNFLRIIRRSILNYIGKTKHFGGCPNCGDRWNWKKDVSIQYKSYKNTLNQRVSANTELQSIEEKRGIMLCSECSRHPERIDSQRIKTVLLESGWTNEDANLAVNAIMAK